MENEKKVSASEPQKKNSFNLLLVLILALFVVLIVTNKKPLEEELDSPSLTGTWTWEKASVDGEDFVPNSKDFTLSFNSDGQVNATTDCNSIFGPYTSDSEGSLEFGVLGMTRMYCPDSQEQIFSDYLEDVSAYEISEEALILNLKDGGSLHFSPAKELVESNELFGSWQWVKAIDQGEEILPNSDVFALNFEEDGAVYGSTDCNNFSGTYALGEDNSITFSHLLSTLKYCEGSQEQVFTGLVSKVSSYNISGDELILELNDGGQIYLKK